MKTRKGIRFLVFEELSSGLSVIGICLILFSLPLAACNATGNKMALDVPSQEDDAPSSILQITPGTSNTAPPTEMPGDESQAVRADLPDLGLAPELENQVWLNVAEPLRLADLGGKVILLDMWTFG